MLKIDHVSKYYRSGKEGSWSLKDVSFSLPSKGLYAILGKSGSGKSTLLNIIYGSEKPTKGEVYFSNKKYSSFSKKEKEIFHGSFCSFIFQHFNLLDDLTSYENVAMALKVKGEKEETIRIEVDELFKKYSLDYLKNEKVALLSGGEKQRIAFLRSVITKPKIILADEPTGALDKENEELVMKYLKDVSKDSLVILVTHNERIVEEYADDFLRLKDGQVVKNFYEFKEENETLSLEIKKSKSSKWKWSMMLRNYKSNIVKNVFSIISATLGYVVLLISLGFYNGSKNVLEKEKNNSLSYLDATISKKSSYSVTGSPLSLTRSERPSIEEGKEYFKDYPSVELKNDYSYFLPAYHSFKLNGFAYDSLSFCPIKDIALKNRQRTFLQEGEAPTGNSLNYCLVNQAFVDEVDSEPLGKRVTLNNEVSVQRDGTYEDINIDLSMLIVGVVKEFSFLSSPKVYYSYPAFEGYLLRKELSEFNCSLGEFLAKEDYQSNYFSYALKVFFSEEDAAKIEIFSKNQTGSISFSSSSFEINSSFESLYKSFSEALLPFLVIEFIGVGCISFSLAYHSYLQKRKESAILSSLGARDKDLKTIYQLEQTFNGVSSSLLALLLSYPLEIVLSLYLSHKFFLDELIQIPYFSFLGIPCLTIILCFLFSFLVSSLGSYIPFIISRKRKLIEELRDE